MANYYESARTNYFKVKDPVAFRAFIETFCNIELVVDDSDGSFCLLFEEGVPSSRSVVVNGVEDDEEIDLMSELGRYLADGSVAVLKSSGAEKLRYIGGYAVAVNNKGEQVSISIESIYDLAKGLGDNIDRF